MLSRFFSKFWKSTEGSVLAYTAMFGAIAIGGGALAVDIGQIILLKSEMQHRADAGALAGARQLDGRDGAQARALAVATNAMLDRSGVTGGSALPVYSVDFLSELNPDVAATDDIDAKFLRVTLNTQQVNFLLAPVLGAFTGTTQDSTLVDAFATAGSNIRICEAPPLMICDFGETNASDALALPANYGRQVRLKEPNNSSSSWAPGNFGLLALPDGSVGANDIEEQLAAVDPLECYDVDVETATGSKTQKVKDGINSRFDMPGNPWPYPAPNVIAYPRDDDLIADPDAKLGSGVWDIDTYWNDKHLGAATPGDLTDASRYQTYLYEQGAVYLKDGKKTLYPDPGGTPPGSYVRVTPPGVDIPVAVDPLNEDDPNFDGVPSETIASNGDQRRVMKIAQLQCIADNVHGHGSYPTHGNFIEVFVTEPVSDPPEAAIYGEVIRALTVTNSLEYYANVGLLE
ncbi:pilus assembly protein TadG-related protein [Kiloniella sp.]|uniref:pilus assembly protein TadG-related protein n=1 Tax=Kiloniella sp. TaxID=1938587 RepID=UPI003B021CBB